MIAMGRETTKTRSRRRRWTLLALVAFALYWIMSWFVSGLFVRSFKHGLTRPPGLALESVTLRAEDGIELAAWVLEPREPKGGTVLLFHGIRGCRQAERMQVLRDRGLRSLAIDFRAHGESGGDRTTFGWDERKDVFAAIRYARKRWPKDKLGAWGMSMGGAAILLAHEETTKLDAVVLEEVYSSIETAFENRFRMRLPGFLLPLAFGVRHCAQWRIGVSAEELAPVRWLPQFAPERVLLARGRLDRNVTAVEFQRQVAALPGATVRYIDGLGHTDLFAHGGRDYREAVLGFLEARLHAR